MSSSPLQQRKLDRMFAVLDVDGNGAIDRSDFVRRVDALARLCGWARESDTYARNLGFALEEWRSLCESADVDEDGTVTREEFRRYLGMIVSDRDAVRAYAKGDVQLLFDAMDTDRDGRISLEEYRRYLEVCGIDTSAAPTFFAYADIDEDGRITRDEMTHAMQEFLLSQDAAAAGNLLFGPLDGE